MAINPDGPAPGWPPWRRVVLAVAATAPVAAIAAPPIPAYATITPSMAGQTITLTGRDMTIEQLVQIARFGAKIALSPAARQRSEDNYGLLLEAAPRACRSTGSTAAPAPSASR